MKFDFYKILSILPDLFVNVCNFAVRNYKYIGMKAKTLIYILAIIAVCLMVGGFFVPPIGVIDGSVLTASGIVVLIVTVLIAYEEIHHGIEKGYESVRLKYKDMSVTLDKGNTGEEDKE